MADHAEQKSYVTDFTIQLGPMFNVPVDLVPVTKPNAKRGKETALVNVCPIDSTRLNQKFLCPKDSTHGHVPGVPGFGPTETAKAQSTEQGLVVLPPEELEKTQDDRKPGYLEAFVADRKELSNATLATGTAYRLRPAKKAPPSGYPLLAFMVAHPDKVIYGMARLTARASSKPFILSSWRGQVVMQEIVPPESMADIDELGDLTLTAPTMKLAADLLDALASPIDDAIFVDTRAVKMQAVVQARLGSAIPQDTGRPSSDAGTDLLSMLQQALAQAPTRPVKAKKAPAAAPKGVASARKAAAKKVPGKRAPARATATAQAS